MVPAMHGGPSSLRRPGQVAGPVLQGSPLQKLLRPMALVSGDSGSVCPSLPRSFPHFPTPTPAAVCVLIVRFLL